MPILDEVRITELPGADPLAGPELIPLVQSGVTKSRSAQNLVLDGGLQEHLDAANPHNQYAFRVLNNLTSNTDPTVNNDSSEGYSVLSKWLNSATTEVWLCLDATVGAAVWEIKTLTTDDLGSAALADVGAGNGLDADLLDGIDSLGFATSAQGDTADSALQSSDIGISVQAHDSILDGTTASYTTSEQTKLSNIEANATADQTNSEIKSAYEANADTNAFTDAEETKLSNVGSNATRDVTLSTSAPSGGSDGDIWYTYTA